MPPASWQPVFELLETHRKESREDHAQINVRLRALENAELTRNSERIGAKQAESRIFGFGRATFAVLLAAGGLVVQVVTALAHPVK